MIFQELREILRLLHRWLVFEEVVSTNKSEYRFCYQVKWQRELARLLKQWRRLFIGGLSPYSNNIAE